MPIQAVIGIQWGDEGKGKVIDRLAQQADVVARCQGGNNAGHTVVVGGERLVLNLLPCGVLHARCVNLIGNGLVVDPEHLFQEIRAVSERGVDLEGRLFVSALAHLILPVHRQLDGLREAARGDHAIGTTKRGVGPAYSDKASRIGIRVGDTQDERRLGHAVRAFLAEKNPLLERVFGCAPLDYDEYFEMLRQHGAAFRPLVADVGALLRDARKAGKEILLEGAQGVLLDLDAGSYPYVTSSTTTIGGMLSGSGLPPHSIDGVRGVAKAYTTRVGEGPFPTEIHGDVAERLRAAGHEFGATTGRPRRCGWFDAVATRYAIDLDGVTELTLTKLDTLAGFGVLSVATAYEVDGAIRQTFPAELADWSCVRPVYETIAGWDEDLTSVRSWVDLPEAVRAYVGYLERVLGVPITEVSVGPDRAQTITRNDVEVLAGH